MKLNAFKRTHMNAFNRLWKAFEWLSSALETISKRIINARLNAFGIFPIPLFIREGHIYSQTRLFQLDTCQRQPAFSVLTQLTALSKTRVPYVTYQLSELSTQKLSRWRNSRVRQPRWPVGRTKFLEADFAILGDFQTYSKEHHISKIHWMRLNVSGHVPVLALSKTCCPILKRSFYIRALIVRNPHSTKLQPKVIQFNPGSA